MSSIGSLDTLIVSTRWGCKPRSDQIRCTVAGLTLTCLGIVRYARTVTGVTPIFRRFLAAHYRQPTDNTKPKWP